MAIASYGLLHTNLIASEIQYIGINMEQLSFKTDSHLAHLSNLNIDQETQKVRETCVVCTLGSSWNSIDGIKTMISNGMNILRMNLSMTSREECKQAIEHVRAINTEYNHNPCIAIAMDMTTAPIRIGFFSGGPNSEVFLVEGCKVELTIDESFKNKGTVSKIFVDTSYFPQFLLSIHQSDRLYLDDGSITLIVKDIGMDCCNCLIEAGGLIGGYKRVSLPRERLYVNAIQQRYLNDLAFAKECEVDFVFTSFSDNLSLFNIARQSLPITTKVFAKIENKESLRCLPDLIDNSDGIIISRTELSMQFRPETIFKIQKYIIGHCNIARRPVFVISQLLESMHSKPRPTRAESSDVANAVLDGVDGLILTVETSRGVFPCEALQTMHRICLEAERAIVHETKCRELKNSRAVRGTMPAAIMDVTAISAVEAAASCEATGIFVITDTGASAMSITTAKPSCPVFAITRNIVAARHCHAYRGLHPFIYTGETLTNWSEDMDCRINAAVSSARNGGLVKQGDTVIIVTGSLAKTGSTNTMQVFKVPAKKGLLKVVSASKFVYPGMDVSKIWGNSELIHQYGVNELIPPL